MKLEELNFHKVLGFQYDVADMGNGLKITNSEFEFNNLLCGCDIIIGRDDEIVSLSLYRSILDIDVVIKLTNIASNTDIKRYFENVLTRLQISKKEIDTHSKAKNTIERIAEMGGVLYVTNNNVYFTLDSFDLKIKLNTENGWDVCHLGKITSTHETLSQAVLIIVDDIKKEGALLPNI